MIAEWFHISTDFFIAYGIWGLFLLSFMEASFLPVPPDILLIAMALAKPKWALWYALIATLGTVLGGLFGYFIGRRAGRPILIKLVSEKRLNSIENIFDRYGGWAVAIAGFTPVPFKLFTIASGLFKIRRRVLVIACATGRGARFFLEGMLIFLLGKESKTFLGRYLDDITIGVAILAVIIYFVTRHIKQKKSKIAKLSQ